MTMSDCDSCSGCPASAEPGTCGSLGVPKAGEIRSINGIEYRIESHETTCRGCLAVNNQALCDQLSERHSCSQHDLIFVRLESRLSQSDFDDLKARAIEQHAGAWLHYWGRMVEEETLRRNGVNVK